MIKHTLYLIAVCLSLKSSAVDQITSIQGPTTAEQNAFHEVEVIYSANQDRDIQVLLQDTSDWSVVGKTRQTVPAGSGSITPLVLVDESASNSSTYQWQANLLPVNGNWGEHYDFKVQAGISLSEVDSIPWIDGPSEITVGTNATVSIGYVTATKRDLVLLLQDRNDWTTHGYIRVNALENSGSINLSVPISSTAPIHGNYQWKASLYAEGEDYPAQLDVAKETGISTISDSGLNNDIITAEGPTVINPGETVSVLVEYESAGPSKIEVLLINQDDWSVVGGRVPTVTKGRGTMDVQVSINSDAPIGDSYRWVVDIYEINSYFPNYEDRFIQNGIAISTNEEPNDDDFNNLLSNSGFENEGMHPWVNMGVSSEKVTTPVQDGALAARVYDSTASWARMQQDVLDAINTSGPGDYSITAYIKADSPNTDATLQLLYRLNDGTYKEIRDSRSVGTEYSKLSKTWEIDFDEPLLEATFRIQSEDAIYVDNCQLQLTKSNPPPQPGDVRVLMIGNSILHHGPNNNLGWSGNWGMAASAEENDYAHILHNYISNEVPENTHLQIMNFASWEKNWNSIVLSEDEKALEARNYSADIICIRLGENVAYGLEIGTSMKEDFKTAFEQFVTYVSGIDQGRSPIIIIGGNFWNFKQYVDTAMEEVCSSQQWPYVAIWPTTYNPNNPDYHSLYTAFGVDYLDQESTDEGVLQHPDDAGMQKIADLLWQKLRLEIIEN